MKLYYSPGACSLSPHIVLREAGYAFDLVKVDLKSKKTEQGEDFFQVNPKGYVPVLELDDGQILTEGPAIVQYLADHAPRNKNLAPPFGTMERYRLIELLNFISTELHKGFSPLFNPSAPPEWKEKTKENLGSRLTYTQSLLGNKPFLLGDQFTVADAYLFTSFSWCKYANLDPNNWPVLQEYSKRVAAREAVQATLKAEGLI